MKRLQEEELKVFVQKGSPRSNVRATISLWGTVALGGVVLVSKSVSVLPSHQNLCQYYPLIFRPFLQNSALHPPRQIAFLFTLSVGWSS